MIDIWSILFPCVTYILEKRLYNVLCDHVLHYQLIKHLCRHGRCPNQVLASWACTLCSIFIIIFDTVICVMLLPANPTETLPMEKQALIH